MGQRNPSLLLVCAFVWVKTPPGHYSRKVPCFEPGLGQEFQLFLEFNALSGPGEKLGFVWVKNGSKLGFNEQILWQPQKINMLIKLGRWLKLTAIISIDHMIWTGWLTYIWLLLIISIVWGSERRACSGPRAAAGPVSRGWAAPWHGGASGGPAGGVLDPLISVSLLFLTWRRAGARVDGCGERKRIGGEQVFSAPHSTWNQVDRFRPIQGRSRCHFSRLAALRGIWRGAKRKERCQTVPYWWECVTRFRLHSLVDFGLGYIDNFPLSSSQVTLCFLNIIVHIL
jgi:hypothetical protein